MDCVNNYFNSDKTTDETRDQSWSSKSVVFAFISRTVSFIVQRVEGKHHHPSVEFIRPSYSWSVFCVDCEFGCCLCVSGGFSETQGVQSPILGLIATNSFSSININKIQTDQLVGDIYDFWLLFRSEYLFSEFRGAIEA